MIGGARRIGVAFLAGLITVACGSPPSATSANPQLRLSQTAAAMAAVRSMHAQVHFGSGISIAGFTLLSASADLLKPSASETDFQARQGEFLVELTVISVGGVTYIRLPFSNFTSLTPSQAAEIPSLQRLLSASQGLPSILAHPSASSWVGSQPMAGVTCDTIRATYSIQQATALIGSSAIKIRSPIKTTIWSGHQDHLIRRMTIAGQFLAGGKTEQIRIDLSAYEKPVTIASPSRTA